MTSSGELGHCYLELICAFATLPGEHPADVRSYVIRALSVDELVTLAHELADAAARGETENVLADWATRQP